ncbi:LOW QUALITY PROTEIN: vomeronasal type-1 receptor 90-like [Microtus pennsylvanicus]|uniref:LOW QUALITY PROTEIN: vomeronasal type-1 receptor 90-like n=1 Tax=Microtus pennsylvanicus TaxID=10058 RepID=UPI003F6D5F71
MRRINTHHGVVNIQTHFFSELGFGISFNSILLLFHILEFLLEHRPRTTDLFIGLLALIHLGMLTIMGFTAADTFAPQNTWNDITCRSLVHLHRFLRGLSLCATCLLSILQAVTLSPRSSCLAKFKHKSPQHKLSLLVVLWVFYMSWSAHFWFSSVADYNNTSHGLLFVTESCVILPMSHISRHLFTVMRIFRDVSFIGLMALSSGYMLTLLCKHKKLSRHLHSTSLSPKASPELRATRTILLLLSFFVLLYCLDCIMSASRLMHSSPPIHHSVRMLVSNSYATISPLLLICTENRITTFLKSFSFCQELSSLGGGCVPGLVILLNLLCLWPSASLGEADIIPSLASSNLAVRKISPNPEVDPPKLSMWLSWSSLVPAEWSPSGSSIRRPKTIHRCDGCQGFAVVVASA